MRAASIDWCLRPIAAIMFACGCAGVVSAQEYTVEVLNRLTALPGIPATTYTHVASTGGAIGDGYGTATGSIPHAMYMPSGATMPIDLHPAGFLDSYGLGGEGSQQVGYGWSNSVNRYTALMWNGSAGSVVNLHPAGYVSSRANASDGAFQVGSVQSASGGHAALWSGTSASVILLTPAGYSGSVAYGVGDGQQVGAAGLPMVPGSRAMVWSGTPESAVDLHSASFVETYAFGVGGGKQAGYGKVSGANPTRALVWSGTAESIVNLHPVGATVSVAYATNGYVQVGDCSLGGAAAWRGSAESFINLHALLPAGSTWNGSRATSIDSAGVITGWAYGTYEGVTGTYVVRWMPADVCIAKYNGDDEVDILDFLDFIEDFSACEGQPAPCGVYGDTDLNGDTVTDILDFLDFIDVFGTGC